MKKRFILALSLSMLVVSASDLVNWKTATQAQITEVASPILANSDQQKPKLQQLFYEMVENKGKASQDGNAYITCALDPINQQFPDLVLEYTTFLDLLKSNLQYIIDRKMWSAANTPNAIGQTLMMLACASGDLNTVTTLATNGASPDSQDFNDNTYLHYAIFNDRSNLANFFSTFADGGFLRTYNKSNKFGVTPYQLAKKLNNSAFIKAIEGWAGFNPANK